jgi:hypothetical protein
LGNRPGGWGAQGAIRITYCIAPQNPSAGSNLSLCDPVSTSLNGSAISNPTLGTAIFDHSGSGNDCSNFLIGGTTSGIPAGAVITSIEFHTTIGDICPGWYEFDLMINGGYQGSGCNGYYTYNALNGQPANGQLLQIRSWDLDGWCDPVTMSVRFFVHYSLPSTVAYSWSPTANLSNSNIPNPIASPTTTTTYTLAVSQNGCVNPNTSNVTVTVNTPSTTPTVTPLAGTICPNTNVSLTASGGTAGTGSNIHWYTGPNGTGTFVGTGSPIVVAPSANTTYYARREGTCNTTADASVAVNVKNYIYATNGTTSSNYCTDNAGWNHFFVGDDIIFSIQGNLSSAPAGFPQVTIYNNGTYFQETEGPGTAPGCTMNITPGEERFEMQRSWNVNYGGGTPMGSYNIRFYYPPAERAAIENAANNWIATYPDCSYSYKYATPNGFYWFKNSGSNYVAPQFEDIQYTASIATTPTGINYSQWTGITGFSGGSGAIILTPLDVLPVQLTAFNATCDDNGIRVNWSTASELNSSHFTVERSRDGFDWETIGTQLAAGTTNTPQNYEVTDASFPGGTIYYRLRQVDQDGTIELYGPISATCEAAGYSLSVYPNPATNSFTVQVYAESTVSGGQLGVYDFTGKAILQQSVELQNGVHTFHFNDAGLARGTYLIRLADSEGRFTPVRLVIQ